MNADICMGCFEPLNGYDVCSHCGWYKDAVPEHAYHLYPGTVLHGRYIIGNSVGVGGFGITYRAWDANLNTLIAIKEFYPAGLVSRVPGEKNIVVFSGDKREQFDIGINRFLDEARNMAKFNGHPNIVEVYDFFKDNNTAYIVMEFLEGTTVKQFLEQAPDGKTDTETALSIVEPLLDALKEIHSKGIIHRDISPDNIIITTDNKIKIFDLGAAKLAKEDKEETRSIVVKTGYTPPEQYRAKSKQGAFTDLYSAGAVLYKLLTGLVPEESVDRIVEDHLEKPSKLGIELDSNLEKVVMKALALKPELRFQSATQFMDALANKKMVDFPEEELKKRRKLRLIFASAITVFALAFIGFFTFYMNNYVNGVDLLVAQDDKITVCLPVSTDEATAAKQNDMYQKIVDQFIKNAAEPDKDGNAKNTFDVKLTTIPQDEYKDYLMSKFEEGNAPTVFNTDFFGDDLSEHAVSLDPLIRSLSSDSLIILDDYKKVYPSECEIPTGFYANVIYVNQAAAKTAGISIPKTIDDVNSLFESADKENDTYTVAIAEDNVDDTLTAMIKDDLYDFSLGKINQNSKDAFISIGDSLKQQELSYTGDAPLTYFLKNQLVYYIDDTTELQHFRSYLPGYYSIIPLTNDGKLVASMTKHVGVDKNASENARLIGMQFIRFMFTDYSQDLMHIQNKLALPLNKVSLENYLSYNSDISFIKNYSKHMKVIGEERHKCYDFNTFLYDNIMLKGKDFSAISEYPEAN